MIQGGTNVRITTEIWVAAYRAKLEKKGIPIFLNKTGDKTAGAILVKVSTMDKMALLFHRVIDQNGKRNWTELFNGSEERINTMIRKQCSFDPDLWVLEIEDPKGRHYLNEFNF